MTKYFPFQLGTVGATIVNLAGKANEYVFARNGDPEHLIFCHINQGMSLGVDYATGRVVGFRELTLEERLVNQQIIVVRRSNDSASTEYNRALAWTTQHDWERCSWVVNLDNTYRAVAYDHRRNGRRQNGWNNEIVLAEGTLRQLLTACPRKSGIDPIESGKRQVIGDTTLTSQVRWERLDSDGIMTECGDPRPVVGI